MTITTGFAYDPYDAAVMNDPRPFYRRLRDDFPLYYMPQYDTYVITRFEDALEMLENTENTFVASEGTIPPREVLERTHTGEAAFASVNPLAPATRQASPVYEALRRPVMKPLRPAAVARLAADIREMVSARLDALLAQGEFDLTQDYGGEIAAGVQCLLFRLPLSSAREVLDAVNAASSHDPSIGGMRQAATWQRLQDMMLDVVTRRRVEGPDGSWAIGDGLFELEIEGRLLSDAEIAGVLLIILVGGVETVPKVVAHGLWELSRRPEQWDAVRTDPAANARTAFREMVRFCAPAQWFLRTVHRPTSLQGVALDVGQRVMYSPYAAAHDEREYGADVDEFRWDREIERLLNFGHGQHFCAGFHLAMLEGATLVEEFVRRVERFEVREDGVVRLPSSFQWGYNHLPIRVDVNG